MENPGQLFRYKERVYILIISFESKFRLKIPCEAEKRGSRRAESKREKREGEMLCVEYILELATERRLHLTAQTT